MKLYRATYSLLELDGHVKVDEQWVFFEAEDRSVECRSAGGQHE